MTVDSYSDWAALKAMDEEKKKRRRDNGIAAHSLLPMFREAAAAVGLKLHTSTNTHWVFRSQNDITLISYWPTANRWLIRGESRSRTGSRDQFMKILKNWRQS